ncbi:hypothetical protein SAMD00079811_58010 [Scytonema sp. HK-05]|uniref:hypothetical protein n=1 Tax=Scytonema sp. HK-05 TaxID=1137095 RepID=UPI0009369640|nr:hypothetical protein [Scytonema sp. HK-05]OKH58833.1 hypothetical protein NIES2130_12055 [Scytonema sp. HK-05]BAY48180.1 hypothetical protein SAMD00079811_58010 [Scytonema sp. HK-05]
MTHLILQILGKSDVLCDGGEGFHQLLDVDSLEDIKQKAAWNDKDLIPDLDRVDFPLIKKLRDSLPSDSDTVFAFILTNQVKWMQERNGSGEGWNTFVTLDGIWWQNILAAWCEQQNLKHYPIVLDVAPKVNYGVADWEGMADAVDSLLARYFNIVENNLIYFQPNESEKIQLEKIIVQHSSGTPALSGALYLWGVEKKLAVGDKIEFAYISEQDINCTPHSGKHWQWRLKDPQIRELLKIQDFSGALKLLDSQHPNYQQLKNNLEFLDKSVSLNLEGRSLGDRESIIERISIALWSEKAFRDRSQWMHWSLRIAGALELALLLLVEKQGNGDYQWHKRKLIFKNDKNNGEISKCSISKIVNELLTQGRFKNFTINSIGDEPWQEFKKFYVDDWRLENNPQQTLGFVTLRNSLYHSLIGDNIDELLDQKTKELNKGVTDQNHPSQIAVNWLNYIIQLAGVSVEVHRRVEVYKTRDSEIKNQLKSWI